MTEYLIFIALWLILGVFLMSTLFKMSNYSTNNNIMKAVERFTAFVHNNINNSGVNIMITYTIKGMKKDLSNIRDKALIRFINTLDKLKGDYDYGQKEKTQTRRY